MVSRCVLATRCQNATVDSPPPTDERSFTQAAAAVARSSSPCAPRSSRRARGKTSLCRELYGRPFCYISALRRMRMHDPGSEISGRCQQPSRKSCSTHDGGQHCGGVGHGVGSEPIIPITHVADAEEYAAHPRDNPPEEVDEFIASGNDPSNSPASSRCYVPSPEAGARAATGRAAGSHRDEAREFQRPDHLVREPPVCRSAQDVKFR